MTKLSKLLGGMAVALMLVFGAASPASAGGSSGSSSDDCESTNEQTAEDLSVQANVGNVCHNEVDVVDDVDADADADVVDDVDADVSVSA